MFLARIDGTVVPAAKHASLEGCRFLVAQRLESDGSSTGEPIVLIDWMGAGYGSTVLVSTDGGIARERYGNTSPGRMVVAGIVDQVYIPQPKVGMRRSA
jgi:ethanolamine utilization protein EutN